MSLNHYSQIDYILTSAATVIGFTVLDPDINFSDHLPLKTDDCPTSVCTNKSDNTYLRKQLRWDQADNCRYFYAATGVLLTSCC